MKTCEKITQLRQSLAGERQAGKRIAFVPTMGNLHEGHLRLVREARLRAEVVVVSIFVNPLQFGPNEDLDRYPRTLNADREKLFAEGVQYLFHPGVDEMYPNGTASQTVVLVPALADTLCGKDRPGHFGGVATVVTKLFQIVQPDIAVFGRKDRQQLTIIQQMVEDLAIPVEVIGIDTARAEDGLALSSRNGFLTDEQRHLAPLLYALLKQCREAIACGYDSWHHLEHYAWCTLESAGFEPDYFAIRDARSLSTITAETEEVAIFAAAKLGETRLIDNITLALNSHSDWGLLAVN